MKAAGFCAEKFQPVKGQDITVTAVLLGENGRGRKFTPVIVVPETVENGAVVGMVEIVSTRSGKPKIIKGTEGENDNQWLDRIRTLSSYVRNACGHVGALPDAKVQVLARGYGAFGDAGRIGTWDDVLISVQAGTWLRVKPSRGSAYYRYYPPIESGNAPCDVQSEAVDAFAEALGITPPPIGKGWYRAI